MIKSWAFARYIIQTCSEAGYVAAKINGNYIYNCCNESADKLEKIIHYRTVLSAGQREGESWRAGTEV